MRLMSRRRSAAAVLTAACALALTAQTFTGASGALGQGTAPSWAGSDPNAVGGITFYSTNGSVVTSGNSDTAPFATFAEGRADTRAGDSKAQLILFKPQEGTDAGAWSNSASIGRSTAYPNASAPAPVNSSTKPVNSAADTDYTLDTLVSRLGPTTSTTAEYINVFEVRLYTGAPGNGFGSSYDYADIKIDSAAHTWSLVYTPGNSPVQATKPATPTGVVATAKNASADVSWTAPSDGGSPITGYDVQYSSDNGTTWTSASDTFHTSTLTAHTISGLSNGTSYVFRVAAINAVGQGDYSTKSAAVTPAVPVTATTSALTIAAPTSVKYAAPVTITGKLTDSGNKGAAIAGASVSLYRKTGGTSTYVYTAKATTTSTGALSFKLPTVKASTYLQWRYAGSSTHKAVNSAARVLTVIPTISAHRSAASVKVRGIVKIYGTVVPSSTNAIVYLQKLSHGKWVTGTAAKIVKQKLPNGTTAIGFVISSKPTARGTVTYRVYKKATATLGAAYSNTTSVKVT